MSRTHPTHRSHWSGIVASIPLIGLLLLPLLALASATTIDDIIAGIQHPLFGPALRLSTQSSLISLLIVITAGTPVAWWLSHTSGTGRRLIEMIVDLPIVLPPAVLGVALLQAYGQSGWLGPIFQHFGIQVPFTTTAVILAQVVVSAPFYIQSAAAAFRRIDPNLLLVAQTLGATPKGAVLQVALPIALPGLIAGATLAWARALGEFGATLLFAGNLMNTTQTMPLAIYTALESDVRVAIALSLVLAAVAVGLLLLLRWLPRDEVHP